jgi:hypothetical protein
MGCDIHDYVEVRKEGKWEKVGAIFPNEYFDPTQPADQLRCWVEEGETDGKAIRANYHPERGLPCNNDCYRDNERFRDHPFDVRNYLVFGILAGVRYDEYPQIAPTRGFPEDASDPVKKSYESWGRDAHTPSWVTLGEFLRYDYDQVVERSGVVSGAQYAEYLQNGAPSSWCAWTSEKRITEGEMKEKILTSSNVEEIKEVVSISWTVPVRIYCKRLLEVTIPGMFQAGGFDPRFYSQIWEFKKAAREGDTAAESALADWLVDNGLLKLEDVRMVFWFDN